MLFLKKSPKFWEDMYTNFLEIYESNKDKEEHEILKIMGRYINTGKLSVSLRNKVLDFIESNKKHRKERVPFDHQGMVSKEEITEIQPQKLIDLINQFKSPEVKELAYYYVAPLLGDLSLLKDVDIEEKKILEMNGEIERSGLRGHNLTFNDKQLAKLTGKTERDVFLLKIKMKRAIKDIIDRGKLKKEDIKEDFPESYQVGLKPIHDPIRYKSSSLSDIFIRRLMNQQIF